MPSYGGAHGPDGSKKTGDQGQGTRDRNGGNTGGGKSVGRDKATSTGKRVGSATAADYAVATGRVSTPSIPSGGVAKGNYGSQVDAYNDYAKAVGSYATRGFFDKALDFLGGSFYDPQEPMAGNPRSFAGGDWHSTSNPGGILGGLAGMLVPGLGTLVGPALGSTYTAMGLPEVWHGGLSQPDMRTGPLGNTSTPMGGTQSAANSAVGGGWGGFNPFGGPSRSPNSAGGNGQVAGLPVKAPVQNKPVTSSLPTTSTFANTSKFPGFPDYSPFGTSQQKWGWG